MENKPPNPGKKPASEPPARGPRADDARPRHPGAQPAKGVSDVEHRLHQFRMKKEGQKASIRHAIFEWTLVRCLAWSERFIVLVAAALFFFDKQRDFWSFSGIGFLVFSLLILAPIYGIFMFVSALGVYKVLEKKQMSPKSSKEYKKVLYVIYIAWIPMIYALSHYGMALYYEIIDSFPVWEKIKEMLNMK